MPKIKAPDDKWYGEESVYAETDEILIDDSIPVYDRGHERLWAFSGPDHELDFND